MILVYLHRKKGNGEVFYVGIGTMTRAYSNHGRNKFWHRTVKKYGYDVEIVMQNISWQQACQIEILLIAQYGRRDLDEGTLVNLTDGGDGTFGYKYTDEQRKAITLYRTGTHRTEETKMKMSKAAMGNTVNKGVKKSDEHRRKISEAHKKLNENPDFRKVKSDALKGYKQSEEHASVRRKPVVQYTKDGVKLKVWKSLQEASDQLGIQRCCIGDTANGRQKSAGGYIWKYE